MAIIVLTLIIFTAAINQASATTVVASASVAANATPVVGGISSAAVAASQLASVSATANVPGLSGASVTNIASSQAQAQASASAEATAQGGQSSTASTVTTSTAAASTTAADTTSLTPTTAPATKTVEQKVKVSMKLTDKVYSADLANTSSPAFQGLQTTVCSAMNESGAADASTSMGACSANFTEGSVVAAVSVTFFVVVTSGTTAGNVAYMLTEKAKSGSLGSLKVDKDSFGVQEVFSPSITVGDWQNDASKCASSCCAGTPNQMIEQTRICTQNVTICYTVTQARGILCDSKDSPCTSTHCSSCAKLLVSPFLALITILTAYAIIG